MAVGGLDNLTSTCYAVVVPAIVIVENEALFVAPRGSAATAKEREKTANRNLDVWASVRWAESVVRRRSVDCSVCNGGFAVVMAIRRWRRSADFQKKMAGRRVFTLTAARDQLTHPVRQLVMRNGYTGCTGRELDALMPGAL